MDPMAIRIAAVLPDNNLIIACAVRKLNFFAWAINTNRLVIIKNAKPKTDKAGVPGQ